LVASSSWPPPPPRSTLFPYTTLFRSTLKPMVPLPVPVAPDVIVIHDAPLTALQLQDPPPETVTVLVLAETATSTVVGFRLNEQADRKSTRLNSSHVAISYAVFCLKKK